MQHRAKKRPVTMMRAVKVEEKPFISTCHFPAHYE
jgi:hypothetical protein